MSYYTAKEKLWTKDFILDTGINFLVYLIYYLLMAIIAVVTKEELHATLAEAGLASGIFIVGTLVARLIVGEQIEMIGRRRMLWFGIIVYFITTLFYFGITSLTSMYFIRLLNGLGYGIVSTATNTIIAGCIPDARRGEGINYYGLSTSVAAAMGPFIGMFMMTRTSFDVIIGFCAALLIICIIGCALLHVKEINLSEADMENLHKLKVGNFIEFRVFSISMIGFWMGVAYSSVLSFLAAYAKELDLITAGTFFFVVYALVITVSRPATGIIFDRKGENYVMYPCFICLALGLGMLSITHGSFMLLLAGVFVGLGYGTFMSNGQAICIKLTPAARIGVAVSTYFVSLDLGLGVAPYVLGELRPLLGFSGIYTLCAVISLICFIMYYFMYDRKQHTAHAHA